MSYFSKKILENCPKIHKRQHFLKMLKQRELFFEQERRLQQYVHRNANLTKVILDLIFKGTQTFGSSCISVFFEGLSAPVCYISQNASCIFSNIIRKVLFFCRSHSISHLQKSRLQNMFLFKFTTYG